MAVQNGAVKKISTTKNPLPTKICITTKKYQRFVLRQKNINLCCDKNISIRFMLRIKGVLDGSVQKEYIYIVN